MAKRLGGSPLGDLNAFSFEKFLIAQRLAQGRVIVAANLLARKIRQNLNKGGAGRFYRSRTGAGIHQASRPGEPPAPDTRLLQRSVRVKDEGITKGARVGVKAPGAATLEIGNRAGTLLPRPYMRPSLDQSKGAMTAVLVTAINVELKPVWLSF